MRELTTGLLLLGGALFSILAAVGIMRMPDFLTRIQAATKAGTLGVGCLLLGVVVWFDDFGVMVRAILVIVFLFMTAPVAAHLISRAAHFAGTPIWEGSVLDELTGRYDPKTHALSSGDHPAEPGGPEPHPPPPPP